MRWRCEDAFGTCDVSALEIVAKNLTALIKREKKRKGRLRTFQAIEDATAEGEHMVGRSTVDRMSKGLTDFEIGNLEAIARAFEIEVWQLLSPTFEPDNLPVLRSVEEETVAAIRVIRGRIDQVAADLAAIDPEEKP